MQKVLWRIVTPRFVAGLEVVDGMRIVCAPPLLRWTLRAPWDHVHAEMLRRGWQLESLASTDAAT